MWCNYYESPLGKRENKVYAAVHVGGAVLRECATSTALVPPAPAAASAGYACAPPLLAPAAAAPVLAPPTPPPTHTQQKTQFNTEASYLLLKG